MTENKINRRSFMGHSLAAGAALTLPTHRVLGANSDIRVAIIGCGGKGTSHLRDFATKPGVRIVAISDADKAHMNSAENQLKNTLAKQDANIDTQYRQHQDFRHILDRNDVDAVVIATPNHWHALLTVMACQAGKDVYVEKPVSHCIWEGRKSIEAARKYNRIVQAGTQQRSDPALIHAAEDIRKGTLGAVQWIHSLWYRHRQPIGKVTGPTPIPEGVDYDLWCGPGPKGPLMRKRLHYDWHWIWAYGNGDMGNIAPHNSDDIRHLLGMTDVPERVMSVGGRFAWDDDGETPNTHFALYDYKVPIVLEIRDMPHDKGNRSRRGVSVYRRFGKGVKFTNIVKCENGFYNVTRGGGFSFDNDGNKIRQFKGDGGRNHVANFLKAARSRKFSDLNADILDGHLGAVMIHQANVAHRVGTGSTVDEIRERVNGHSEEGVETLNQMLKHLHANEVDLKKDKPVLSPWLTYSNDKERFVGAHAEKANKYVKDNYRAPYVVPEKV